MKLTEQEVKDYTLFVDEAHYAICKQIHNSSPMNNYGTIEFLVSEQKEYEQFLEKMLNKRIKRLTKLLEDNNK